MSHWELIEMIDPERHSSEDPDVIVFARHWFFDIPPMNWGVFKQFIAITIFKYILFRNRIIARVVNHELIHVEQQGREVIAVIFYIKYGAEFIYNFLIKYPFQFTKAYHNISYEIEAYQRTH